MQSESKKWGEVGGGDVGGGRSSLTTCEAAVSETNAGLTTSCLPLVWNGSGRKWTVVRQEAGRPSAASSGTRRIHVLRFRRVRHWSRVEVFSAVDLYTSQKGLNHVGTGRVEVFSAVDLYTSQKGLNHVGTGRVEVFSARNFTLPSRVLTMWVLVRWRCFLL